MSAWFSRFAQPTLNAWTLRGKAVALEHRERHKEDEEAKTVACYGALEEKTGQALASVSSSLSQDGTLGIQGEVLASSREGPIDTIEFGL
jgi:hypothetical protein